MKIPITISVFFMACASATTFAEHSVVKESVGETRTADETTFIF